MINVNKKIQNIARLCHEANRALQIGLYEEVNPPWDDLSEDLKDSTYIGVLKALDGVTTEQLHESWMQERILGGWKYGEVLDRDNKVHPNLVPYKDLPLEQQLKDGVFLAIVSNYRR